MVIALRASALDAFRADSAAGPSAASDPIISAAVNVAACLQAAVEASDTRERDRLVAACAESAMALLGPERNEVWYELPGTGSPTGSIRALALQLIRRERIRLAFHILESLAALYPRESLEGGRILKLQSVAFTGEDALGDARISRLLTVARRLRSDELLFLAAYAHGQRAMLRGNLPALVKSNRSMWKYAERLQSSRAVGMAVDQQSIVCGMRRELGEAIVLHAQAIRLADSRSMLVRALSNAGETLFRAGHYTAARAARAYALANPDSYQLGGLMITLGGYAVACAALRDIRGVSWAVNHALAIIARSRFNIGVAQGLLGCADAAAEVGLDRYARELYEKGKAMADANGYYGLQFRPDPTRQRTARRGPLPLAPAADSARESIQRLAPDGVSLDLTLVPT